MLFDEKIGGTVHLALGRSIPESLGKNQSAIHWDMLCDMKKGGKIYADNELVYKDGNFNIIHFEIFPILTLPNLLINYFLTDIIQVI